MKKITNVYKKNVKNSYVGKILFIDSQRGITITICPITQHNTNIILMFNYHNLERH